ncbi:MAG: tRNA uridine(34) 5-carboxymethylaminomethyl modification radical SAM/GNAT enzyme Elp3 [Eggerthellaceae bacterium]|nr:tRNA uridine(34) 5-carboxymethylaminomethyl modification radical SAM/GNAT enzyme Elp3 [Eggerthellaceae bacterium]
MEAIILDIANRLKANETIDANELARIIRAHNEGIVDVSRHIAKKKLLPFYLHAQIIDPAFWSNRGIDDETETKLLSLLQVKPRRTASGVATITVITKPHTCSSACIYCPNDIRMPKSYLSDEPACQRAERAYFDPYLQVVSRMKALTEMGHPTDKIELIVLGGTWSDYPLDYQYWFMTGLFRALNDMSDTALSEDAVYAQVNMLTERYRQAGISRDRSELAEQTRSMQARIDAGELTYNQAFAEQYDSKSPWSRIASWQKADSSDLAAEHERNHSAGKRVVGLVVETRPDLITPTTLTQLRSFGCTKVQIGIQSLDESILRANHRAIDLEQLTRAFDLLRLFGFKTHTHFMVNLYGSNPEHDKADYERFVTDARFLPDEVKLYPCVLVKGTPLASLYESGAWQPYDEETLIDVLAHDVTITPPYTRISRMIRDISAKDIVAGSKKTNLRQLVDGKLSNENADVSEIRTREINDAKTVAETLDLDDVVYETHATTEHFLQWVTPEGLIAGFLRLSLPHPDAWDIYDGLPTLPDEAMIREVHVYGKAAKLHTLGKGAQHHGLGKALIARACEIAQKAGYGRINVISAIGTYEYYSRLGFRDSGLYQQKGLD